MNLLIHADHGSRSDFLGVWLIRKLSRPYSKIFRQKFTEIYRLVDESQLIGFDGVKIRIRPTFVKLDIHMLLFLRTGIRYRIPGDEPDEYNLETLTKLSSFANEVFKEDSELIYDRYTHVINFEDTFDVKCMIDLYTTLNNVEPSAAELDALHQNIELNNILIDSNHAASIVKLIFEKEAQLRLKEENRFWSIVDIYNTVPTDKLYESIDEEIYAYNYGINRDQ